MLRIENILMTKGFTLKVPVVLKLKRGKDENWISRMEVAVVENIDGTIDLLIENPTFTEV